MMLRRSFPVSFALFAAASAFGCSTPQDEPGDVVFPEEPLAVLQTEKNMYTVEVRTSPSQPPSRGRSDVELRFVNTDGEPSDGLQLSVTPFMPDMAHATSTETEVDALGDGRYQASPVDMVMAGHWVLRLSVEGPASDGASIEMDIE
ncbi:MAG: FixH family protein [Polyangiaceae bacterium]|nr:FixH family protein [Polyangiaceae bacterium]